MPRASEQVEQGEALLQQGDGAGAKALFEEAIAAHPDDARAHLDLGLASELLDDVKGAEAAYRRAAELQPNLAEALNNLGVLLRDRGALDEAIPLLRRAAEANPKSAAAHANLALALEDQGDVAGAEQAYRAALRIQPTALTQANLGLLLLARGDQKGARQELQQARALAEGNRAALVAIGNGLRRAGDPQGALQAMQAAVASDSQPTPALLSELALAQYAAGERSAAVASLERALDRDPRYATAHYLLGNMLASDGKRPQARKHFQRYLALEPKGPHAAQAKERAAALGK